MSQAAAATQAKAPWNGPRGIEQRRRCGVGHSALQPARVLDRSPKTERRPHRGSCEIEGKRLSGWAPPTRRRGLKGAMRFQPGTLTWCCLPLDVASAPAKTVSVVGGPLCARPHLPRSSRRRFERLADKRGVLLEGGFPCKTRPDSSAAQDVVETTNMENVRCRHEGHSIIRAAIFCSARSGKVE